MRNWLAFFAAATLTCACNFGDAVTDTGPEDSKPGDTHTTPEPGHDVAVPSDDASIGVINIHVKGETAKAVFGDGLSGQTPADYRIAISSYRVLRSASDPSPTLCFDYGDKPFVVDVARDNLVGVCPTQVVPSGSYTHGRTKVAWARYTVDGAYHLMGQTYPGKFTFFRAYSDVTHNGKPYKAGHGSVSFSGLPAVEIPVAYGPMPNIPGVRFETIGGEFFMTFRYTKPLLIGQNDPGVHWARFHWKVGDAFRWNDSTQPGHKKGVWDVSTMVANTESVMLHGVSGYFVTSSQD